MTDKEEEFEEIELELEDDLYEKLLERQKELGHKDISETVTYILTEMMNSEDFEIFEKNLKDADVDKEGDDTDD